ncbi:hypothetical protein RHMOL_Rhmol01G0064400 [Rhododendron molle]|uniref:Uncharacterized protein n=1 Tax=Rhododendron molle TaxID=49168 RepID=A0ACC0PZ95_RHOML|nr:hypothetical protein RHMOL_Rhmol01G0064400 [Rhododendron molle]
MEEEEPPYPPWLKPMLKARFFSICDIHKDCKDNEQNRYCLDCTTDAFCPGCLIYHKNHRVTQIRRSSYNDVIRVDDVQKYLDVHDIQPYTMNQASVVFLNERPQTGPRKGYKYACEICQRSIAQCLKFCSLGCKLGGIEDGISGLRFNMSINYHTNELGNVIEVDGPSKETKLAKLDDLKQQATEPFHSPASRITKNNELPNTSKSPYLQPFQFEEKKGYSSPC